MSPSYAETFTRSIEDPDGFWLEQAGLVDWIVKPTRALDDSSRPFYRWYPGASLNTCYNALDRHVVNGRADQAALVYDSPVAGSSWRRSPPWPAVCVRSGSRRVTGSWCTCR